jgi:dipeptidase E
VNLYLSSFRIGERPGDLRRLASRGTIGLIPNALDHAEPEILADRTEEALHEVRDVGIDVESLDLTKYFGAEGELQAKLADLAGVWVRGGNTFVLRQAMRLSGFDESLLDLALTDFFYGGYSAGVCVLAPRLDGLQHVDDPTPHPYSDAEVIWEGLGLIDYLILPHYKSDHPESAEIDGEVDYCVRQGIPFRTLRDGEVIVLEDHFPRRNPGR